MTSNANKSTNPDQTETPTNEEDKQCRRDQATKHDNEGNENKQYHWDIKGRQGNEHEQRITTKQDNEDNEYDEDNECKQYDEQRGDT